MKDTARVLGRTFDGIEHRGFAQEVRGVVAQLGGAPASDIRLRIGPPAPTPGRNDQ